MKTIVLAWYLEIRILWLMQVLGKIRCSDRAYSNRLQFAQSIEERRQRNEWTTIRFPCPSMNALQDETKEIALLTLPITADRYNVCGTVSRVSPNQHPLPKDFANHAFAGSGSRCLHAYLGMTTQQR